MAISYEGERNTPSQCGMMDFCVAMGPNRVGLMIMNDSSCELKVISIAQWKLHSYFTFTALPNCL
mgnify:CR=1 FL=1